MRNGTTGGPDNEKEAAEDFDKFLSILFRDAFPQFLHLPLHITGESFGGTYVPGFVDYTIDAVVDMVGSGALGQYDHMCKFDKDGNNLLKLGYNQTTCRQIEKAVPECERLNQQCIETYDGNICRTAYYFCHDNIEVFIDPKPGGRYLYDDRLICNGTMPLCGADSYDDYLNSAPFQGALGLDHHWNFSTVNFDFEPRWEANNELFMPTTRELEYILDETSVRVLAINGNNDLSVTTEGQQRVYDHQPWSHQAKYRMEKSTEWMWPDKSGNLTVGGDFQAVDKLAFASVDDAGHTSPGDQREAVAFLMKCWVHGATDEACPF